MAETLLRAMNNFHTKLVEEPGHYKALASSCDVSLKFNMSTDTLYLVVHTVSKQQKYFLQIHPLVSCSVLWDLLVNWNHLQAFKFRTVTALSGQIFSKQAVAPQLLLASGEPWYLQSQEFWCQWWENGSPSTKWSRWEDEPFASLLRVSRRWFGLFVNPAVFRIFLEGC